MQINNDFMSSVFNTAPFGSTAGDTYLWVSLITAACLLLYRLLSYDVRRAWLTYGRGVQAPGEDSAEFKLVYRIQMNMLEHMVFFLPSLWLCAVYGSLEAAQWLGLAWLMGRTWYAVGYYTLAKSAALGFRVGMVTAIILFVWGSLGASYRIPIYTNPDFFIDTLGR